MADEIKSEVELQDGAKEETETEKKKKGGKSKSKEKVAETLKKVGKADDAGGEVEEAEEVQEKDIDLFSESAMYNAYSICHNVQVGVIQTLPWIFQQFYLFRISCTSGAIVGREW